MFKEMIKLDGKTMDHGVLAEDSMVRGGAVMSMSYSGSVKMASTSTYWTEGRQCSMLTFAAL